MAEQDKVNDQAQLPLQTPQTPQTPVKATATTPSQNSSSQAAPAKPVSKPSFVVQPVKSLKQSPNIKMCIYGKFGVGKTTLAATACDVPSMRDVIIVSAEAGELSLLDNSHVTGIDYVDRIRVTSFKQIQSVTDFLSAHMILQSNGDDAKLRALQDKVFDNSLNDVGRLRKYKTIIIDSLTEINDMCLSDLLGMHSGFSLNADVPAAEFREYKQNFTKMQMFVRKMRDLPANVIVIMAADWDQDETKKYHYMPALTGKLSSKVQGFFDIVGFLQTGAVSETGEAPRRLWVQPVGASFEAKTRLSGVRKSFFDNPTMPMIMQAIGVNA